MGNISLRQAVRRLRSVATFWIAEQTLDHLSAIRTHELDSILPLLPRNGRLLEIGAGTGWQANILDAHGLEVHAIDVSSSNLRNKRIRPIVEYDGQHIPFPDGHFDVVFSSNVLEHIAHVREFQSEVRRVLSPGGLVIHLLPSSSWRLWTSITYLLRYWAKPPVHGELAANALTELYFFSRGWWSRLFCSTGWTIVRRSPNGLFYTGCSIMDSRLSTRTRNKMARILGSSCNIFVLQSLRSQPSPSLE